MKIEVGKSYRFVRDDGAPDEVVTLTEENTVAGGPTFWFKVERAKCDCNWIFALEDGSVGMGACWGRLVELNDARANERAVVAAETRLPQVLVEDIEECAFSYQPGKPRPLLGDDPGALDDFRRVFATWDFRNGT